MARPLPLLTQYDNEGRKIQEGDIRAGDAPPRSLLLPPRSFHPSRGDRDRTVRVGMASCEDGGSVVVEGGVVL